MKKSYHLLLLLVFLFFVTCPIYSQDTVSGESIEKVYTNKVDNNKCFKCHGRHRYELVNAEGKIYKHKMPADYVIDTNAYYQSNHWNFTCFDCHSSEYQEVPHKYELRFFEMPACIDCHGGDENFAKYNFEMIEKEFVESVHSSRHNEDFSCWSCHDAHTYKINARNKVQNITMTVAYDNSICLSCHASYENYQLYRDTINPNIISKHDWLPNQPDHFRKVRCIECHAAYNDSILVAHNIQPKIKAVRNCVECHSSNSILMKSLYKYQLKEARAAQGFLNSGILGESYVIGANRNYYLNMVIAGLLILTLLGICVHVFFRIRKKQKNQAKF